MTNVITVDFKQPEQTIEQMFEESLERYAYLNPHGVQLIANIGDTDVLADHGTVYVKVYGETVLSFQREGKYGLQDLVNALQSQIKHEG